MLVGVTKHHQVLLDNVYQIVTNLIQLDIKQVKLIHNVLQHVHLEFMQ